MFEKAIQLKVSTDPVESLMLELEKPSQPPKLRFLLAFHETVEPKALVLNFEAGNTEPMMLSPTGLFNVPVLV